MVYNKPTSYFCHISRLQWTTTNVVAAKCRPFSKFVIFLLVRYIPEISVMSFQSCPALPTFGGPKVFWELPFFFENSHDDDKLKEAIYKDEEEVGPTENRPRGFGKLIKCNR